MHLLPRYLVVTPMLGNRHSESNVAGGTGRRSDDSFVPKLKPELSKISPKSKRQTARRQPPVPQLVLDFVFAVD
jgi:hypothetical protein